MPPRVSLAMLVERDSPTLVRCLDSCADLVDEIVIVTDPGASPDWSSRIAEFDARLVEFDWRDDFAMARNESLRHATGEWVFYLDADEWLDEPNRDRLRRLLGELPADATGFLMDQVSQTALGRLERIRQVRLFRNDPAVRWQYRLHEQVAPALAGLGGVLAASDLKYLHDGYQDRQVLARKRQRNFRVLGLDLQERPDDPFVLYNAGVAALDVGRPADAARLFQRCRDRSASSSIMPPDEELDSARSRALSLAGDRDAALRACREGLLRSPENPELLFVEGTLLLQSGRPDAAESSLLRSIERRPNQGRTWQVLTDLYLKSRRLEDAETLAWRLDTLPGMTVDAAACRSRVEFARKDVAAARRTLEAALEHVPAALLLQELYATVLLQTGDRPAARSALRRLLALDPSHRWANQRLDDLRTDTGEPSP